jgi:choline monooxygenase
MSINETLRAQLRANKRPVTQASVLPAHCYSSQDWYQDEIEKIFMKEWICVGRESQVARNGDYFTIEIGREPVVVARDHKNVIHAFLNVCRHRASKIVEGSGNARTFVCKYHCWTYNLDGDLLVVPGQPSPMIGAEDFDRKMYGLIPLRIEGWGGFLFVSFSEEVTPLMEWLGDLPKFLENYRLHEMVVGHELSYDVPVNWKLFVENTMESYHAGFLHNKFLSPDVDQAWKFLEAGGPYEAMYSDKSIMNFGNLPPADRLNEKQKTGLYHVWLHPNTTIHVTSTYMTYRRYIPRGVNQMTIMYAWCFLPETIAHPDFETIAENYYKRSVDILSEDIAFIPKVQEGLSSSRWRPGRYSPTEAIVHKLGNYIVDRVAGDQLAAAAADQR